MLDPITTKLLKEVLSVISKPLLNIVNSLFHLGHAPKTFKLAVKKKKKQTDLKSDIMSTILGLIK